MVYWLLNFWRGYLILAVTQGEAERLINLLLSRGISIWDIRVQPETHQVHFSMYLSDFRLLRPLLRKTGIRVRILQRRGLPFFVSKMWTRPLFWIGAVSFVVALVLVSQVVWVVEVEGNRKYTEDEIRGLAAQLGLREMVFRSQLPSYSRLQLEMLKQLEDVLWVGIEVKGSKARIQIVEATEGEQIPPSQPRQVVARKNAVVEEIYVEKGTPVARRNQMVRRGDVLISGLVGPPGKESWVAAKGTVRGVVWYETTVEVPLEQKQQHLTGQRQERHGLVLGGRVLTWDWRPVPFDEYKEDLRRWQWSLGPVVLPLGWSKSIYHETISTTITVTEEQAFQLAKERARAEMEEQIGESGEIRVERVLQQQVERGKVRVKLYYETVEDIAAERPLIPPEQP